MMHKVGEAVGAMAHIGASKSGLFAIEEVAPVVDTGQGIPIDQFIRIVDSYIRWCNEKRIKISLGSLSPLEYRESLGITA